MAKYDEYVQLGVWEKGEPAAHTAWLISKLPEQVKAFYGVEYCEEVMPPSDISPNWTLRIECHTCTNTNWSVSIQSTNAVYASQVEEGESRMVWMALWKPFHEHLHFVHSPSGYCKCSALINHMAPHKGPVVAVGA